MYRFILKRLLMLIPVLLGVSFIVYTTVSYTHLTLPTNSLV